MAIDFKEIEVPMYPSRVFVCLSSSRLQREEKSRNITRGSLALPDSCDAGVFHLSKGNEDHFILFVDMEERYTASMYKKYPREFEGLIAHECCHVKQYIFRDINEKNIGDETEAYLVQYLYQGAMAAIDNYMKPRKKK